MDHQSSIRVGLAASFTPQPLLRSLREALGPGSEVLCADFNQIHAVLLDPAGGFEQPVDRLVVLWRVEDIFAAELTRWVWGESDASGLLEDVTALGALVGQAAAAGLPMVATIPPVPTFAWLDPLDTRTSVRLTILHGQLVEAFMGGIAQAPVTVLDLAALQRTWGTLSSVDLRNDLLYHQPYARRFIPVLGTLIGEALTSIGAAAPKVIAVDADNTLWGGILGEDGADGVQVGDAFPGNAFRSLQQGLVYQATQGALLALVSKNNESDVAEVFERREADLILTPQRFAAQRVDWNSKADNLQSIAAELNLGVESFIFVDDNPVEVAEVDQRIPGVQVIQVSDEPAEIASLTAGMSGFRFAQVSAEDRDRTAMMRQESVRVSAAQSAPSQAEFLASLDLSVRIFAPTETAVGRVAQLINKTNQFNLTTHRRSEAEVAALVSSPHHRVYAAEVSDRFGGYGLVVAAVVLISGDRWEIDTFLMSCRVLRRGVEDAVLGCIAQDAASANARILAGSYVPTAKNVQVATFFSDRGFVETTPSAFEAYLPLDLGAPHVRVIRGA